MKSPKEFLEAFLQKKVSSFSDANGRLEPIYAEFFGDSLRDHIDGFLLRDLQAVDQVAQTGQSATVITRAHFKTADVLKRYQLAAAGESWKIVKIERQCFMCAGGQSGSTPCRQCGGEGWIDPRASEG